LDGGIRVYWKKIKKYPNYEISDAGKIRISKSQKQLKPGIGSHGYLNVVLSKNNCHETKTIHSLVAEAFLGIRPEKCICHHKDGNKLNNKLSNLEYISYRSNLIHALNSGLNPSRGSGNFHAKLKESEVWLIKKLLHYKVKQILIAKMFLTSPQNINHIAKNRRWNGVEYVTV